MLLDDMATYYSSGGGWTEATNLFAGDMPAQPAECLSIYEVPGSPNDHTMGNVAGQAVLEHAGIQVVSRAATYQAARRNAQKAYVLTDGLPTRTINGVQYYWGSTRQPPFLMGRDEQGLPLICFNADILKDLSSTS